VTDDIISATNLSKTYKVYLNKKGIIGNIKNIFIRREKINIAAVDNISFIIKSNSVTGLLGPNGAGKTTIIKMLTGILSPTDGTIKSMGLNPFSDRKKYVKNIGVCLGQKPQLWWDLPVIESYKMLSKIYSLEEDSFNKYLNYLIKKWNLEDLLFKPVRKLSLGQLSRCNLIASILHKPKLLFLDEPTLGLDIYYKNIFLEMIKEIKKDLNTTIILTSHNLYEIEELCNNIILIDKGKIIFSDTLQTLKNMYEKENEIILILSKPANDFDGNQLKEKYNLFNIEKLDNNSKIKISFDKKKINLENLISDLLVLFKNNIKDIVFSNSSLEKIIQNILIKDHSNNIDR
jgi:ABC-2 type transport system ATP-binding protein